MRRRKNRLTEFTVPRESRAPTQELAESVKVVTKPREPHD